MGCIHSHPGLYAVRGLQLDTPGKPFPYLLFLSPRKQNETNKNKISVKHVVIKPSCKRLHYVPPEVLPFGKSHTPKGWVFSSESLSSLCTLMKAFPTSGLNHTGVTGIGSGCVEILSPLAVRGSTPFVPHHEQPLLGCSKDVIIFHACLDVTGVCGQLKWRQTFWMRKGVSIVTQLIPQVCSLHTFPTQPYITPKYTPKATTS